MKKLTVCILTHKRANYLQIAIERILNQSFKDFDLLIVDDCSPDHTTEIVRSFNDPRINYVRNETNLGFNANYNKALSLAQSPYILLTHDDDEMTPTFLAREVAILDQHPKVALVATNTASIDAKSNLLKEREIEINTDKLYDIGEYCESYLDEALILCCPTYMFRRSHLEEANIRFRDIGPGSDTMICLETNLIYPIYLICDPIFKFRAHDGQDHVQLKNSLRANFRKELSTWRILKDHERMSHRRAHLAYRLGLEFPVHLVADLIETDATVPSPAVAVENLLEKLETDELEILEQTPKLKLLYRLILNKKPKHKLRTSQPLAPPKLHSDLLQKNDQLLELWEQSPQALTDSLVQLYSKTAILWGIGIITILVEAACHNAGINVLKIIDNDKRKTGARFLGKRITRHTSESPPLNCDAIIICIENENTSKIYHEIHNSHHGACPKIYTWKELVKSYDNGSE